MTGGINQRSDAMVHLDPPFACFTQAKAAERLPRFYVPQRMSTGTTAGGSIVVEGEEARHMLKALRLKEGDAAEICDGLGSTLACRITALDPRGARAWVRCPTVIPTDNPHFLFQNQKQTALV